MATTQSSSSPRNHSSSEGRVAVLVTAPRCTREGSNGAIEVEPEQCDTIDVANSPANTKPISAAACNYDPDTTIALQQATSQAMTHIVAPSGEQEISEGFDACREYGYKYEYTDDNNEDDESSEEDDGNESDSLYHSAVHCAIGIPACLADNLEDTDTSTDTPFMTHVLGKTYHPATDFSVRRQDESSLFWFTYRCDFPRIAPYSFTTDAGWGCMLRSAQMMLGQTLRLHYQSREWRPPPSLAKRRLDPFVRRVLTWMADFPSKSENVYSLHNMVAAGIAQYQVLPGEWWGPGTVSHVLCDLCDLYEEQHNQVLQQNDVTKFKRTYLPGDIHRPMFRVYVAPQGTVYRDSLQELMTRDAQQARDEKASSSNSECEGTAGEKQSTPDPLSHPLDPLYNNDESQDDTAPPAPIEWDTAALLLIPIRLGLKSFNQEYSMALAHIFSLKQSVGVLGGRPRGARWFYGANSDGSTLFGLDPHTVQVAPHRKLVTTNVGTRVRIVAFTDEYLRSVHTKVPDECSMSRMDPSMALGFYCRDKEDFEDLVCSLQKWKEQHAGMPQLFTVEDAVPDYTADMSCAMNEMMMHDEDGFADAFEDEQDNASDEDEYVLL